MNSLPAGTVAAAIFDASRCPAAAPAFLLADGSAISFAEAASHVARLARHLRRIGVQSSSRIAFAVPRGPLGVIGFLAASSVGVCCPFNPRLKADEWAAACANMGVTFVLDGLEGPAAALAAKALGLPSATVSLHGHDLVVAGEPCGPSAPAVSPGEIALLVQTSGTTSRPKLVALSHANVLAATGAIGGAFGLAPGELCLNPMPLHHVHGLLSAAIASLLAGSAVHCAEGFAPAAFETLYRDLAPTWFTASPAMHLALRDHFEHAGTRPAPGRLRFFRSSSAPLPAAAIGALEALFDAPLIETYGLSETASMICSNPLPPAERKRGSVGFAFGAEIRIVDATGATCPPDVEGEIAVRGPSVITAYLDNAAPGSFAAGWLLTGDVGRLDADGYLTIVGRTKELIKRGGLSVYPSEVDEALAALPTVAEAVTFAVPHPTLGEDVVSAVVLRPGATQSGAALRAELSGRLSTYKIPSLVLVTPGFRRNETGKIVRRDVAAALEDRLQPQGLPPANEAERALLRVWRGVLGRDDIGVTDNLFLLGGDPLRAERAAALIAADGIWRPTLKDLLAAPTVREQAARADRHGGQA